MSFSITEGQRFRPVGADSRISSSIIEPEQPKAPEKPVEPTEPKDPFDPDSPYYNPHIVPGEDRVQKFNVDSAGLDQSRAIPLEDTQKGDRLPPPKPPAPPRPNRGRFASEMIQTGESRIARVAVMKNIPDGAQSSDGLTLVSRAGELPLTLVRTARMDASPKQINRPPNKPRVRG